MTSQFKSYPEWLAARRQALSRGGLWLEGGEPGRPDPGGFDAARLRILICRLSPYDDVLASITHRMLLDAARTVPGVYADLAFFPPEQDAAIMQKDGIPFWLATGSKRAPADFDVLAVSLSVQQEAVHFPAALQHSSLRLDFAGRMAEDHHPLVVLGGHGAGSVPFLHGDANGPGTGGLADAVCLGDGITWLREFAVRWIAEKKAGRSKQEFLTSLARELPGTYVPALYRHVVQENRLVSIEPLLPDLPLPVEFRQDPMDVWLKNYTGAYIPFSEEELEETLPLAAGCVYRCRFCQTGWMRGGFSAAARDPLWKAAVRFKAGMVNSDLNLLAADACSVSGLDKIMDALCPLFNHVSVKSLSVSSLVHRPEYVGLLQRLAKHEFTFGVEGISARLRAYLGKPATAGDLIRIAGSLADGGLRQLKLFFIATGLENDRDLKELELLLKGIRSQIPACRIIASFMPLFHAPFTPLQFAPARGLSAAMASHLSALVREAGGEFRWSAFPDEIALMNRLCRAGRSATPALVDFSIRRGLRYYKSLNPGLVRDWARVLPDDPGEKSLDFVFPWSNIRAAVDQPTLWRAYQKACRELQAIPQAVPASRSPSFRSAASPKTNAKPGELDRLSFWAWIQPEQARHPDHVIVRDFFRILFAGWEKGIAAYLGRPLLLRPPGTSGLVMASADFKRGTLIPLGDESAVHPGMPTERVILGRANPVDIREKPVLFGVQWPTLDPAEQILKALKQDRVKFQTVRQGKSRWHVVERAFRARTGILALREDDRQTRLFCERHPMLPANDLAFFALPAGVVNAILAKTDSICPACKGAVFNVLKSVGGENQPTCFDCLTRPDRWGR
jgi:radical SAM superfamily enzyme YgiQ (UPF0313 family)